VLRNFVHVDDLVGAILTAIDHPRARHQLMNVCMDEPIDYVRLGEHLARTRGLPQVPLRQHHHSTWLDNSKAKFLPGWRPQFDLERLVDEAWAYRRPADEPRRTWYPG
jgi:nucleoside-diphosphate-sugar epimerase